jgi:prepilin-type N-terminal cleavage/methylation domain-containing protein
LAFTLIELLTVISIIAVLAGMVVGLAPVASAKMKEARVRGELAGLVTAIESYKAKFGVYPPDHTYRATFPGVGEVTLVNPIMNTLYYELTGALVDNRQALFFTADDEVQLRADVLFNLTGREGFVNAIPRVGIGATLSPEDRQLKRRLFSREFKAYQSCEIFRRTNNAGYVDFEVLAVGHSGDASGKKGAGVSWPLNIPAADHPIPTNPGLNPWRFDQSHQQSQQLRPLGGNHRQGRAPDHRQLEELSFARLEDHSHEHPSQVPPFRDARLYPDRTAGRHRDHRDSCWHASPRRFQGPGKRPQEGEQSGCGQHRRRSEGLPDRDDRPVASLAGHACRGHPRGSGFHLRDDAERNPGAQLKAEYLRDNPERLRSRVAGQQRGTDGDPH